MEENLVRWVLSREYGYLQKLLNVKLTRVLGAELTTPFGRVDLAFRTDSGDIILIELETIIDSDAKLQHTMEQIERYSKFAGDSTPSSISVLLLYADEGTPEKFKTIIEKEAKKFGVKTFRYSSIKIKQLYDRHTTRIILNSGTALSRSLALGVSSLSWLNKIMEVFANRKTDNIEWDELKQEFNSKTNFYVLKRLAEDFELISKNRSRRKNYLRLTDYGSRYVDIMDQDGLPDYLTASEEDRADTPLLAPLYLRRLLIEILLNNNFTKTKVNIFKFLRYINVTAGELLPKRSTMISPDELQYLNKFLGASYNVQTLKGHFQQLFKYGSELGLLERISCRGANYDKAMLTSLGSRVLSCFDLHMHLARERHQIPLQIER